MSESPTRRIFSKLSLEAMPPMTRSQSHRSLSDDDEDDDNNSSDAQNSADDSDEDDDNGSNIVQSPNRLRYDIQHLSPRTQRLVRALFDKEASEEPPQVALKWCRMNCDADGEADFYAFEMQEIIPRSIRIGSGRSSYPEPQCRCQQTKPCSHLILLHDCIAKAALYDHDPEKPLTLNDKGFADEVGLPFDKIKDIRLDVLASQLHCDVAPPATQPQPDRRRIEMCREMLAAIQAVDEYEIDDFRRDLLDDTHPGILRRGDVGATLFQLLLLTNNPAAWVRSTLDLLDRLIDPFRSLERRVMRVLEDLDAYVKDPEAAPFRAEGPCNVTWAAEHIIRSVSGIKALLQRSDRPLEPSERASAARALVRILGAVVERNYDAHPSQAIDDRNLYQRLVGNARGSLFVIDALDVLPDQTQIREDLEEIAQHVGVNGAPYGYGDKINELLERLRSNTGRSSVPGAGEPQSPAPQSPSEDVSIGPVDQRHMGGGGGGPVGPGAGSKRQGSGPDRGAKRAR